MRFSATPIAAPSSYFAVPRCRFTIQRSDLIEPSIDCVMPSDCRVVASRGFLTRSVDFAAPSSQFAVPRCHFAQLRGDSAEARRYLAELRDDSGDLRINPVTPRLLSTREIHQFTPRRHIEECQLTKDQRESLFRFSFVGASERQHPEYTHALLSVITLKHDTLSFTFPEIARQVRALLERQIQEIVSELPACWDRAELVAEIESSPLFHQLSPDAQESARATINTWTPAHVEAALEEAIVNRGGLNTNSFAELTIKFQRTMRIPNDGKTYALPTGLGQLPLRSIDDFPDTAPASWMKKGGVLMPLHQSDALWTWFSSRYYFAVKIGAAAINALSGGPWSLEFQRHPQNYLLVPDPPWYENNEVLRRHVSMPLVTDNSPVGSEIQFEVTPLCAESYYRSDGDIIPPPTIKEFFMRLIFGGIISTKCAEIDRRHRQFKAERPNVEVTDPLLDETAAPEIIQDHHELAEWDQTQTIRCFIHPCDSSVWRQISGTNPPHPPLIAKDYNKAGIPWFDSYQYDGKRLPEGSTITPGRIVSSGNTRRRGEIREFLDIP